MGAGSEVARAEESFKSKCPNLCVLGLTLMGHPGLLAEERTIT